MSNYISSSFLSSGNVVVTVSEIIFMHLKWVVLVIGNLKKCQTKCQIGSDICSEVTGFDVYC